MAATNIFKRNTYRKINTRMLVSMLGLLIAIESLFMLPPCFVSMFYDEYDVLTFAYSFAITAIAGGAMYRMARPTHKTMGKREGFLLTASVWVVFSMFGMLPFIISPAPYTLTEAFSESMSCFTTTGATIVPTARLFSHGMNLWRAMMQWVGGMGIILFTLAVLPMLNYSGGMQMFNAEVTGITHDKIRPRISQTAKGLWSTYMILTVLVVVLLWLGPLNLFDSITHGLVTMATGGISYYDDGVEHFSSRYVKVVITVFMFFGSVNFGLIYNAAHGRVKAFFGNGQLRFMLQMIAAAVAVVILVQLMSGTIDDWLDTVVDSVFMVISAISTTCFGISGTGGYGPVIIIVLACLMFFGGCAGSTSGGAKTDRLMVLLQNSRNEIWRALQPNSIGSVKIGRTTISHELVQKSIAFLCIDVMVIVVSTTLLGVMNVPVSDGAFLSVSCISNSGLLIDYGSYGGSLVPVPAAGKILLSMVMLIGRLEFYTILVLFTRNFWHR